MKRKLALLLALIMVLAMVPANVFAQQGPPGSGVSTALNVPPTDTVTGAAFTVTLAGPEVHSRLLAGNPFEVILQLSGSGAANLHFRSNDHVPAAPGVTASPDIGNRPFSGTGVWVAPIGSSPRTETTTVTLPTPTAADPNATVDVLVTMTILGRQLASLIIDPQGPVPILGLAALPIDLGQMFGIWFNANAGDAVLTAFLGNVGGVVLASGPLSNFGAGITMAYQHANPVVFEWDANIGHLNITENRVNAIAAGQHFIRLTSPVGYKWGVSDFGNLLHPGDFATFEFSNTDVFTITHPNNSQELVIRTTIARSNELVLANRLGRISIRGLILIPDYDTPLTGDLNVRMRFGRPHETLSPSLDMPGWNANHVRLWDAHWIPFGAPGSPIATYDATFLVAQRRQPQLALSVVGDLPELRSGYVMGLTPNPAIRPLHVTEHFWGQSEIPHPTTGRTAILRVQENVLNALDMSRGRPVTFTIPEGFILTGIEWRYYRGDGALNDRAHFENIPDGRGNAHRVIRPAPGQSQAANADVQFTDTSVTLRPNMYQHLGFGIRSHTFRLEVRFFVSVAAGAAAEGLDELVVTVTGPGVANLPANANSIAVATVFDPVTIEHSGDVLTAGLVGREQNIYHADAGAITITETEGGMLQRGTRLHVEVARRYGGGMGFPLLISRGDVLQDANTGLGLRVADITPVTVGNNARQRIVLEVTRESLPGNPGSITIDGITLFGHVYQGEVYYLVVSGSAVAENHAGGIGSPPSLLWNPTAVNDLHGLFLSPPYAVQIVNFTGVEEDIVGDRANSITGMTFNPATMVDGAPEMIWYTAPGMVHEGGFVGLRAFANVAGAAEINWVASSRIASIAGWDHQGNWVTITMEQGSPWAQITRGSSQGTTDLLIARVDIAEFSDGRTGPSGTVVPVFQNNRIYVPFRFVFNAFGYSADYDIERAGQVVNVIALP